VAHQGNERVGMLGPEGVADAVVDRLRKRYPARLEDIRERKNIKINELPDIVQVFDVEQELQSIERFPCVFIVEVDTDGKVSNQATDQNGFQEQYMFRYKMRAFIWVVGEEAAYIARAIRRYILATREILMTDKILVQGKGVSATIDPTNIRESVGDMAVDDAGKGLGMAYVEFDVLTQESLTTLPYAPDIGDELLDIGMDIDTVELTFQLPPG
jgi:hypothetical protein